jgi:hypothetical protein
VAGVTASGASEFKLVNLGVRVPIGLFTGIAQVVRVNDDSQYAVSPGDRGSGTSRQPAGFVAAGDPRSKTVVVGLRHSF